MSNRTMHITKGERAFRAFLILLMSASALWGVWHLLVRKPAIPDDMPPGTQAGYTGPRAQELTPASGVDTAAEQGADEPAPAGPYTRREDCWTFLLIGMDRGGGNTDSLMLVTYDVSEQRVSVASIARDTRVDADRRIKKINAAYADGGVEQLKREVSDTFGIPVDFYFRVNINGFIRLVNAVDGVDFNVPCYMNYDDPEQNLSIHYSKGMQHLNGRQALEVCRFRQNNGGTGYGDEGRQKTQRALLAEVLKKVLKNPGRINEYIEIAKENLETDMPFDNLAWFAAQALSFDMASLNTMSMPCQWINPYMYLNPDATLEMVNEYLNPYVLPRTADMLNIVTRNR